MASERQYMRLGYIRSAAASQGLEEHPGASDSMPGPVICIRFEAPHEQGVVTVGCHERACVTLLAPTAHQCFTEILQVAETLRAKRLIPANLADQIIGAATEIVGLLPAAPFEQAFEESKLALVKAALDREGGRRTNQDG